jgi:hypothetical protein
MTRTNPRQRTPKTTTNLAPPPPRFPSVPPEYRSGEHIRLSDEDERALNEIWDTRAAAYDAGMCAQRTGYGPAGSAAAAPPRGMSSEHAQRKDLNDQASERPDAAVRAKWDAESAPASRIDQRDSEQDLQQGGGGAKSAAGTARR